MFAQLRKYEECERIELKAGCNIFAVPEWTKVPPRRRVITEPLLNDRMRQADFEKVKLPPKAWIRQQMASSAFFCQLDASAYFDQFGLSPAVSSFFGFRTSDGRSWRQRTLPMGFRASCLVAQCVSEFLLDLQLAGVRTAAYIDNFLFFADDVQQLKKALTLFRKRCQQAGVRLNESEDTIYAAIQTPGCSMEAFDCLGERYCLHNRTRTLTDGTRKKLELALGVLDEQSRGVISARRLAAVFGVAFYATHVVDIFLGPFFDSILFFRHLASEMSTFGWNGPAGRLSGLAAQQTRCWLLTALAKQPVPMAPPIEAPQLEITTDASSWGWGAVCRDVLTGKIQVAAVPWSQADRHRHNVGSSVSSEPLAVVRAACLFVGSDLDRVRINCDHAPLVFAGSAGYARCRTYNETLCRLRELFPNTAFRFSFVPGRENKADELSRGTYGCRWPQALPSSILPSVRVG
jgi:hypothetical protein